MFWSCIIDMNNSFNHTYTSGLQTQFYHFVNHTQTNDFNLQLYYTFHFYIVQFNISKYWLVSDFSLIQNFINKYYNFNLGLSLVIEV